MKLRLEVNKLESPRVDYVSLVTRGANRMPFKIVKQEKRNSPMINFDLSKIFKKDTSPAKEAPTGPSVAGIVIQKEDLSEPVQKALSDAGLSPLKTTEFEDGTVLFSMEEDIDPEQTVPVRVSDRFVALMKNFDPYSIAGEGNSFVGVLKDSGYLPGVGMAMQALQATIGNTVTKEDGSEQIGVLLNDFHEYTAGITSILPASVFKADASFVELISLQKASKAKAKDEEGEEEMGDEEDKDKEKECKSEKTEVEAKKEEAKEEVKEEAKTEEVQKEAKETPSPAQPVLKAEDVAAMIAEQTKALSTSITASFASALSDALSPVNKSLSNLDKQVATLGEAQQALKGELDSTKELAQKADKVLKSSVVSGGPGDDPETVRKQESGELGLIDTAFNRNVRRVTKTFTDRQFGRRG